MSGRPNSYERRRKNLFWWNAWAWPNDYRPTLTKARLDMGLPAPEPCGTIPNTSVVPRSERMLRNELILRGAL